MIVIIAKLSVYEKSNYWDLFWPRSGRFSTVDLSNQSGSGCIVVEMRYPRKTCEDAKLLSNVTQTILAFDFICRFIKFKYFEKTTKNLEKISQLL